ncbi:hypothetical protein MKMG_01592 [Methanogenium sp. MK-MG]|nr:hypothetical protein MKMG_01592 [Methanogenium sp. MK-MG]
MDKSQKVICLLVIVIVAIAGCVLWNELPKNDFEPDDLIVNSNETYPGMLWLVVQYNDKYDQYLIIPTSMKANDGPFSKCKTHPDLGFWASREWLEDNWVLRGHV